MCNLLNKKMMGKYLVAPLFCTAVCLFTSTPRAAAQADSSAASANTTATPSEPFAFGDFSWLNGNNRQKSSLLDSKYFTGSFTVDLNYTHSNHNPIDNTVVGSTALARNNEVTVSFVGLGGDFHYNNVRGRFLTQFGTRSTVVPRNDNSINRGQYDLATAYRYISEAYGGYHFNTWHGINVDAGIFMSYIGLFSYNNFENWAYQPSFTSDNTPWFFNGVRVQAFPTDKLKVELWLINGWQSYAKFNKMPGMGFSVMWRPVESFSLISNNYFGTDVQDQPNRSRWHTDNSVQVRYYNQPSSSFISRAAFSLTGDLGFENGGGVTPFGSSKDGYPAQNFISGMFYNRVWFGKAQHFGWTFGGGYMHNPGRYLVLVPTGVAGQQFDTSPGTKFNGWDASTTIDWMPNDFLTFRAEFVHRAADIPYFAGHGGVTSPDGYTTTPIPSGWKPDLVKSESRGILALLIRF